MYDLEDRLQTPSKPNHQSTHPSTLHHQHRHHSHHPQPPLPDNHSVVGDGDHRTSGRGDRGRGCGAAAANTSPQMDQVDHNDFDVCRVCPSHRQGGGHNAGLGDEVAGRICVETSTGRRKGSTRSEVATELWSQRYHRAESGRAEERGTAANLTGSSSSSTCSSGDGGDGGDGGSPVAVVKGEPNVSRTDDGCASRGAKAGGAASTDSKSGKAGKTARTRRSRRRGSAVNPPGIVLI